MSIYNKNEAADLSPEEKKTLKAAVHGELKARKSRSGSKKGRS